MRVKSTQLQGDIPESRVNSKRYSPWSLGMGHLSAAAASSLSSLAGHLHCQPPPAITAPACHPPSPAVASHCRCLHLLYRRLLPPPLKTTPQHYASRCILQSANWRPLSCSQAMALQKIAMDASWRSGGYDKADFAAILGAAFCICHKFLLPCKLRTFSPVIFCRTNPSSNAADD